MCIANAKIYHVIYKCDIPNCIVVFDIISKWVTIFFNELPVSKNQPDPVQYLLNVAKQQIQDNYENIDDALPLVTLLAQDKNQDVRDVAKRLATFILCV